MLSLILALALSGGPCTSDSQCELFTAYTCDCCRESAALNLDEIKKRKLLEAAMGQCNEKDCSKAKCAPEIPSVAKCWSGSCVKVPRPATPDAGR